MATKTNGCTETFDLNFLLFLCLDALSCFTGRIIPYILKT